MLDLISKAARTNGYDQLPIDNAEIVGFRSPRFKDVILVANYTSNDLSDFEQCIITLNIMEAFDIICEEYPDALKSTSLIICHKVLNANERDGLKNTMLKIEENSYGLRKFVVNYTDESVQNIAKLSEAELVSELHTKLQDEFDSFLNFKTPNSITEYDVILQLFIKLPFMKMQSSRASASLPPLTEFLEERLAKHSSVRKIISDYANAAENEDILQPDQDIDSEIDKILRNHEVARVLSPEEDGK